MNHSRSNAPVRFCPSCGEAVNKQAPSIRCDETKHNYRRKERNHFCCDCGKKLRTP
jgi:rRNA maturation endonuclease Nob1